MEKLEKQIDAARDDNPNLAEEEIFELEKQLDQAQAFVRSCRSGSAESLDLKNKQNYFNREIKRLNIEILKLRIKNKE